MFGYNEHMLSTTAAVEVLRALRPKTRVTVTATGATAEVWCQVRNIVVVCHDGGVVAEYQRHELEVVS